MKKLLLATDRKFWLKEQGSANRISDLYRYLVSKEFDVFVFLVGRLNENDLKIIQNNYADLKLFTYRQGFLSKQQFKVKLLALSMAIKTWLKKLKTTVKPQKLNQIHQARARREVTLDDFFSQKNQTYFRKICLNLKPDCIIVEYLRLAYLVEEIGQFLPYQPLMLIDTHDVAHQRYERFSQHGEIGELKVTVEEEKHYLSLFDVVLAIQNQDCKVFQQMLPNQRVIEVGYTSEIKIDSGEDKPYINISYVAGPHPANQQAIAKFIDNVWHQLYCRFHDRINLNIFGRVCENLAGFNPPKNVNLIGWVDDLPSVYKAADIIINPIYCGTGLKIKNVEALCYGKPLVTTSIGAEGLEQGKNKAFIVCDCPECTVKKISELIEKPNLRKNLAQKAYAFARRNFTEDKVYQELYNVLMHQPEHNVLK